MSRLAKTGGTLLGLAALGTFVAALGGPNVFSTFSNVLSTISPKTEIAVDAKKEEKQDEDKASVEYKPEEQKEWIKEEQEVKEVKADPPTPPVTQPVPTIVQKTRTEPQVHPEVISPVTRSFASNSLRSSSSARRLTQEPSGKDRHRASSQNKGGNTEGSGIWCGTSWGSVMMKEGDTCLGIPFEKIKETLTGTK